MTFDADNGRPVPTSDGTLVGSVKLDVCVMWSLLEETLPTSTAEVTLGYWPVLFALTEAKPDTDGAAVMVGLCVEASMSVVDSLNVDAEVVTLTYWPVRSPLDTDGVIVVDESVVTLEVELG